MSKFKNLVEALNITGAELINSEKGYDLYLIKSYGAAQAFEAGPHDNIPAGIHYAQNEDTFNRQLGGARPRNKMYFFTKENSNKVILAALKGAGSSGGVHIGDFLSITATNYIFENEAHESKINAEYKDLPLYLLPELEVYDSLVNPDDINGAIRYSDNALEYCLQVLLRADTIQLLEVPHNITRIGNHAFSMAPNIVNIKSDNREFIERLNEIEPSPCENILFGNIAAINTLENPNIPPLDSEAPEDVSAEVQWYLTSEDTGKTMGKIGPVQHLKLKYSKIKNKQTGALEAALDGFVDTNYMKTMRDTSKFMDVKFPDNIKDRPITKISDYAFMGLPIAMISKWPSNLREIGKGAFFLCSLKLEYDAPYQIDSNIKVRYGAFDYWEN